MTYKNDSADSFNDLEDADEPDDAQRDDDAALARKQVQRLHAVKRDILPRT